MIEVFKTNITDNGQAATLVYLIHENFADYKANFDLQDCDNILRIECLNGLIEVNCLIKLLNNYGCTAEVLMDAIVK